MLLISAKFRLIEGLGVNKKAFTLIEMIFVVVIVAFLSVATFKALQMIAIRSYKAKETTKLSLQSQIVVDQISEYLSKRVPSTVIGYDPESGDFEYIGEISNNKPVLEWFGMADESFVNGDYSEFIDMAKSDKDTNTTYSPDTNGDKIETNTQKKFNISDDIYSGKIVNLIFAGSFDRGSSDIADYKNSFGWHGNKSDNSFDIDINSSGYIKITDSVQPKFIYEKYYLVDSAYAIARGEDINQTAECIKDLNISANDINDTLLLFYNYRPWNEETFCADKPKNGENQKGNVAILMKNVARFRFEEVDYTIRVSLDINKSIKGSSPIHLSKMKVVF